MRPVLALAILTALLIAAPAAAATYTVNVMGWLDLNLVAAGATGDTVFRISPSTGVVTVQSGSGRRIATGSARAQVTVTCTPGRGVDETCNTANVNIRVGTIGSLTGRARALTNFTVAPGTATIVGTPTGTNPLAVVLGPIGNNSSKTFFVAADFPVAGDNSGLPSGVGENGFFVNLLNGSGVMLSGDTDMGKVVAYRALAIAKSADLAFGRIQIPPSGSSTITLDAASGVRSVTGTAFAYPTPAPTRAAFMITGEGGQQVSLSVPASLNLTGPSTIPVTLTDTAPNAPSLNGTLGSAGAYNFTVGGSFTVTNTTPTGAYAGVLTVSVDYN